MTQYIYVSGTVGLRLARKFNDRRSFSDLKANSHRFEFQEQRSVFMFSNNQSIPIQILEVSVKENPPLRVT